MVEIRWTDQAIEDINSIAEYIANDSLKYANIQVGYFFESEEVISQFPLSGRIVPELNKKSIREIILGQYRVIYRIINKSRVDIIAVHHSKRVLKFKKTKRNK